MLGGELGIRNVNILLEMCPCKKIIRNLSACKNIFRDTKSQGQPFLHLYLFFTFVSTAGAQVVITV